MKLTSVLKGNEIEVPEEDFRRARRVEQYRVGDRAVYIPAGLCWTYLPFAAVREAEESHRSVTAGKCVAVTEKRPSLLLKTETESIRLDLEKEESRDYLLSALRKVQEE